ncbi:MAG: folylpolyglutamate synthase/dihydrofolate synthase family protein [Pseudomonadota bacterium]
MDSARLQNLADWVEYIQQQHWRTIEMKLDRITRVWRTLNGKKPETVVTVAGTNGKGSSVAMIESIYFTAGYATGSYTSPHLVRFNERFRINGREATDAEIIVALQTIETARGEIPLTYFEFSTLCALVLFQRQQIEVAVLEVGMGGRLDAVNMIDNDIALITSIGVDHQQWLGSDPVEIAREKAGVIKPNTVVVVAQDSAPKSIEEVAETQRAEVVRSGSDYYLQRCESRSKTQKMTLSWVGHESVFGAEWSAINDVAVPLQGDHQSSNLGGVLAVIALMQTRLPVSIQQLKKGLAKTRLSGRCQIISESPLEIIDVAHNTDSVRELAEFLSGHPVTGSSRAVAGILEDKDVDQLFRPLLGEFDEWHFVTLEGERGQTGAQLAEKFEAATGISTAVSHSSPVAGYESVRAICQKGDRMVVFGSFFTVGDILAHLNQRQSASKQSAD